MFKSVTYNSNLQDIPARVNRVTGELQINPRLWSILDKDYKEFILFHEAGHLELRTQSEAAANNYALHKFIKVAELNDTETARRIVVLSEITNPRRTKAFGGNNRPDAPNDESNFSILEVIADIGRVSNETFKIFGLGRKAAAADAKRALEAKSQAAAADAKRALEAKAQAAEIAAAQAKQSAATTQKLLLIGGTLLLVILVMYYTLKN